MSKTADPLSILLSVTKLPDGDGGSRAKRKEVVWGGMRTRIGGVGLSLSTASSWEWVLYLCKIADVGVESVDVPEPSKLNKNPSYVAPKPFDDSQACFAIHGADVLRQTEETEEDERRSQGRGLRGECGKLRAW